MSDDGGSLSKLDDKLSIAINGRQKQALTMVARKMQISLSDLARIALNEYVARRYPDYDNLLNAIPEKPKRTIEVVKEITQDVRN